MDQAKPAIVVSDDGLRGTIVRRQRAAGDGHEQVVVRFDDGRQALIDASALELRGDGSYTMRLAGAALEGALATGEQIVIPVIQEEIAIGRREVQRGVVRLRKVVREHEELVDEPLLRERVDVERVTVDALVDANAERASVRREGEVLIIPVLEEVLVVEKRLLLKEELRVTMRREAEHNPQRVTLRSEEVLIERDDERDAEHPAD